MRSRSLAAGLASGITTFLIATLMLANGGADTSQVPVGQSEHERSDRFWRSVSFVASGPEYESFDALMAAGDAVLLGTLLTLDEGRSFGEPRDGVSRPRERMTFMAVAKLQIDEIIYQRPGVDLGRSLDLEIMVQSDRDIPDLQRSLPVERAVYFVYSKGLAAEERGLPRSSQVESSQYFGFTSSSQGLVREIDGRAHGPIGSDSPFLAAVEGESFQQVLGFLRDRAAEVSLP